MCSAGFGVNRKRLAPVTSPAKWTGAACNITLIADVAQSYFTLSELDLELAITRRTLSSTTRHCNFTGDGLQAASPIGSNWTTRSPIARAPRP